ncbi:MAG: hypothetical protein LBC59_02455 [Chitinispirillales bacterium]|jgi:hypothetical protein|nr:hypothetical protein [Chitinispirillales bacterium]
MNLLVRRVRTVSATALFLIALWGGVLFAQEPPEPVGVIQEESESAPPETPAVPPAYYQQEPAPPPIYHQAVPAEPPSPPPVYHQAAPVAPPPPPPTVAPPEEPSDTRPNIAVYVTGEVSANEKKALGTYILDALVNSGRFHGIERAGSFLAEVEKEHVRQRDGAVDYGRVSKVGAQFGVKFVCIADITPALGAFQVSARIVNVETAEVAFIGQATGPLKTIGDLTDMSARVVRKMFGVPDPAGEDSLFRKPRVEISVGVGGVIANGFGGGLAWPGGERIGMPYSVTGAYLFFDAVYAELFFGYAAGDGQWGSNSVRDKKELPSMPRAYINAGVFCKYPFRSPRITFFPLIGMEYGLSISGSLKFRNHNEEIPFDGQDNKPAAASLSSLWGKFGAGFDFAMGKSVYLRTEAVYGVRGSNAFEHFCVDNRPKDMGELEASYGTGLDVKVGVGAKF